mmetsp:Transcript_6512/g.11415  ORF Transcript_6512/g.11415 Transcript_6512/m.11415 type:complete len:100 (-) Transcript_6512:430-729(-)
MTTHTYIHAGNIQAFANMPLEVLNMEDCGFNRNTLKSKITGNIKDLPQSITYLDLSYCDKLEGNLESLPKSVTNLNLEATNIEGKDQAKAMFPNAKVVV